MEWLWLSAGLPRPEYRDAGGPGRAPEQAADAGPRDEGPKGPPREHHVLVREAGGGEHHVPAEGMEVHS